MRKLPDHRSDHSILYSALGYLCLSAGIFAADLNIKRAIEARLSEGETRTDRSGMFRLTNYHNHGAMLNAGENDPKRVTGIALFFCILLTLHLLRLLVTGAPAQKKLAVSMLLGGAYSNLYDRFRQGYVTDYISFPKAGEAAGRIIGRKRGTFLGGIVFNISDFFILAGALMTALSEVESDKGASL